MKYGIREICDVVLKNKATGEPVIYFDSLKTSTMEGAATTVYAQGGRGNSRLIAWEGERTVTFTMEDALISELGLQVLTGAGLIKADENNVINVHTTARFTIKSDNTYNINEYVVTSYGNESVPVYAIEFDGNDNVISTNLVENVTNGNTSITYTAGNNAKAVMFDLYIQKTSGAQQIEITADKFGGNYYLEASTLFRSQDGVDHPAEFVIPNCKVQSNFTFTMASSGDPSTFTFTMDAFPDYTKFDASKKVFCAIQILDEEAPISDVNEAGVKEVVITGPDNLKAGTSVQMRANGLVNWSIDDESKAKASITKTGYLTIKDNVTGEVKVIATAQYGEDTITDEHIIDITAAE